jgi:hypothetical protein
MVFIYKDPFTCFTLLYKGEWKLTITKFRNIDILIFTVISVIIDFVLARYGLFGLRMYISLVLPISLIVIVRWRKWGLISLLAIAISHIFGYWDNHILVIMAHIISLSVIALAVFLVPKLYWRNKSFANLALIYLILYLPMIFIEWALLLLFGREVSITNILLNHSVNFFLGLFILFLVYLQKDLVVDMKKYFINKEKEKSIYGEENYQD